MAESLDNSEDLGGIAVHLDLERAAFNAGVTEVRAIATTLQSKPITVRVVPDIASVRTIPVDIQRLLSQPMVIQIAPDMTQMRLVTQQMQTIAQQAAAHQLVIHPTVNGQLAQQQMAALINNLRQQAGTVQINPQVAGGSVMQASIGMQNAGQQMHTASIAMQNAAEDMLAASGRLGAGGGGGGRGAGGGGGFTRGRNLFSVRGLGSVVPGGITAAFAAIEAINVASGLIEASNIASHPERQLQSLDRIGQTYNAAGDPTEQKLAAQMADIKAGQKRIETVESIPLIGSAVKMFDAMGGRSDNDAQSVEMIGKQMQAAQTAVEHIQSGQIQIAEDSGDKRRVADLQNQRDYAGALDIASRNPDDPNSIRMLGVQNRINKDRSQLADQEATAGESSNEGRGLALDASGRAIQHHANQEGDAEWRSNNEAKRIELLAHLNENTAKIIDPDKQKEAKARDQKEIANFDANAKNEQADRERNDQTQMVSMQAEFNAARARTAHDGYAAELAIADAAANDRLQHADANHKALVQATNEEERKAIVAHHDQMVTFSQQDAKGAQANVEFIKSRDSQGAQLADFDRKAGQTLAQLAVGSPEYIAKQQELQADREGMTTRFRQENGEANQSLEIRKQVALEKMAKHDELASTISFDQSRLVELRTASPQLFDGTKSAVVKELKERKFELNRVDGGAVGENHAAGEMVALPQNVRHAIDEKNRANKQLDTDIKIAKNAQALKSAVPASNGGGATAKNNEGKTPGLLEKIQGILQQILEKPAGGYTA